MNVCRFPVVVLGAWLLVGLDGGRRPGGRRIGAGAGRRPIRTTPG